MHDTRQWFSDAISPYERHQHRLRKTLVRAKTRFQKVLLADSWAFGRCLILDGEIQSAERDEFIYHECLVHPAMVLHPGPRRILVLGGGEGATLREILRHPSVRRVVMVDFDGEIVKFCRRYLRKWHQGAFSDERVNLRIEDAGKYIRETEEQFDIIVSDLPTPACRQAGRWSERGPLEALYSRLFYRRLARRLKLGGILVTQAGSGSPLQFQFHAGLCRRMKSAFKVVRPYYSFVPSFDVPWGFIVASQGADPSRLSSVRVNRRLGAAGRLLRFYDGETHEGLFRISKYARKLLT